MDNGTKYTLVDWNGILPGPRESLGEWIERIVDANSDEAEERSGMCKTCETCKWCEEERIETDLVDAVVARWCRRHPQKVSVLRGDWCGEWAPREEKTIEELTEGRLKGFTRNPEQAPHFTIEGVIGVLETAAGCNRRSIDDVAACMRRVIKGLDADSDEEGA